MVKPTLSTQPTVAVKLTTTTQTMLVTRCEEHAALTKTIKDAKARQERIKSEVEDLVVKAGEGAALVDGMDVAGHKVKLVCGTRKVLDKGLLVELGVDPELIREATTEQTNKPYIRISAPGEKGGDE